MLSKTRPEIEVQKCKMVKDEIKNDECRENILSDIDFGATG